MKRIVLKPVFKVGESVEVKDKTWVIKRIDDDSILLKNSESNDQWELYWHQVKDLIESPNVESMVDYKLKKLDREWRVIDKTLCTYDERIKKLESASNHFPEVKEMVDQVADAPKAKEEKPVLKLRVGGSYRIGDHLYDLIEEVQQEQDCASKENFTQHFTTKGTCNNCEEKEALEYCECCECERLKSTSAGKVICYKCKKPIQEGNPFKVREDINAYYVSASDYACYVTTKVTNISGDLVYTERGSFHYKQCERV